MIPKPEESIMIKGSYKPVFPVNIDIKVLKTIVESCIQPKSNTSYQEGFIPQIQYWFKGHL